MFKFLSSRTLSSAASTVRRVPVAGCSGQSNSSSSESPDHQPVLQKRFAVKESNTDEVHRLTARTHCLKKLNRALETELQTCVPTCDPQSENMLDHELPSEVQSLGELHKSVENSSHEVRNDRIA